MSSFPITSNLNALSARKQVSDTKNSRASETLSEIASDIETAEQSTDSENLSVTDAESSTIRSESQTLQNFQRGISTLQTARDGINQVSERLQEIRNIAGEVAGGEQSGDSTRSEREDVQQLVDQIESVVSRTQFNGEELLSGDFRPEIGQSAPSEPSENGEGTDVTVEELSAESLGLNSIDISSPESAQESLDTINASINQVATLQNDLSAAQERLESAVDQVQIERANQEAASSRIRDVGLGQDTLERLQQSIQDQADASALTQAQNIQRSSALQLLG